MTFTTNIQQTLQSSDIIYICVNTPPSKSKHLNYLGKQTDMSSFYKVVSSICESCYDVVSSGGHKVIVEKSTVPVGTHKGIKEAMHSYFMYHQNYS
jgi:UDPglucose 6-dehydrogenase